MSSVVSFTFDTVELRVATLTDKPWRLAKEVGKALKYNKKTADVIKTFCGQDNSAQKYQLITFLAYGNFMDWSKESRTDGYYINEVGMYELLVSSQQLRAKDFRKHCCNVMFSHIWQQLIDKIVDDYLRHDHQQALTECDNRIQVMHYENIDLHGKIEPKGQEIAASQRRYLSYRLNIYKNNSATIVAKRDDESAEYPYISICRQHGYRTHKPKVLLEGSTLFADGDIPKVLLKGSTLFADGDIPNVFITYSFWKEHRLTVFNPNRSRYYRLDAINQE